MDKAVKRHILKKRIVLAKRSDEPMTFTERAPRFFRWFEEDVMGFDSREYRREFWREAYRHGRTIGHVPHTLSDQLRRRGRRSEMALFDALCISLLMGGAFAIWVMRRRIDLHLHRLRRPSYYETERARRLGLTEERRRIRRRTTLNPRPTADQLREAFLHARDSVGNMVRLGSLMEDLECYIDNSPVFGEDGKIIARKGGIRRYIQSEMPDLYKSYKTLMRYKALARRFRQAVGICDPVPAASVLPEEYENTDTGTDTDASAPKRRETPENTGNRGDGTEIKRRKHVENMVRTGSQGDAEGGGAPETGENRADIGSHVGLNCVENMVRTGSQGVGDGGRNGGSEGGSDGMRDCVRDCVRDNVRDSMRDSERGGVGDGLRDGVGDCGRDGPDGGSGGVVGGRSGGECAGSGGNASGRDGSEGNGSLNDEVRRVVGEILGVCEGTFLDLAAVLALRISEDTIPHRSYKGDYRRVGS